MIIKIINITIIIMIICLRYIMIIWIIIDNDYDDMPIFHHDHKIKMTIMHNHLKQMNRNDDYHDS